MKIDSSLFLATSISEETLQFNAELESQMDAMPDMWSLPIDVVRKARAEGNGTFPLEKCDESAEWIEASFDGQSVRCRLFRPKEKSSRGTYFHIHGGGWTVGSATAHDERLREISDRCGLHILSVEYRLAPENPYPDGPDDCLTAARWLLEEDHDLPTGFIAIGGESAGANLSLVTMLRLRDLNRKCPFDAAVLTAGVYDLGGTASARNWGTRRLVLNSRDMEMFVRSYTQNGENLRNPDISPLYADLTGLPPVFMSVGTEDLLLDDTLQLAALWQARNGNVTLEVTPGGCHVFQSFRHLQIAKDSNAAMDAFLKQAADH